MSAHDEDCLRHDVRRFRQALADVCAIVEAIPEADRVRLGLYSMEAFNRAYALLNNPRYRDL